MLVDAGCPVADGVGRTVVPLTGVRDTGTVVVGSGVGDVE